MEVIRKKRIPAKPTFANFDVFKPVAPVATRKPPAVDPKPKLNPPAPPTPPPLAASSNLPHREPLQPAQRTLIGLPLVGYPGQQHTPLMSGNVGGVQLYRCKCGMLLVEFDGRLWWVPVSTGMTRIETVEQLGEVLSYTCSHALRLASPNSKHCKGGWVRIGTSPNH